MTVKLAVAVVGIVVYAMALVLAGIGSVSGQTSVKTVRATLVSGDPTASETSPGRAAEDNDTRVSLVGDEITTAVAEYLIDDSGNLYELHAPQTEITRLGAPEL